MISFPRKWVEAFLFFQIETCEGDVSDSWIPEYWIFWGGGLVDLDWQKQWSSWEKHPTVGPGSASRECPWWECFELLQVILWFLWPNYVPCVWSLTYFFSSLVAFASYWIVFVRWTNLYFLILIVNIWDGNYRGQAPACCFGVATCGKGEGSSRMDVGWWVVRRTHRGVGRKSTTRNCDVRGRHGAEESKADRRRRDWWFLAGVNLPRGQGMLVALSFSQLYFVFTDTNWSCLPACAWIGNTWPLKKSPSNWVWS